MPKLTGFQIKTMAIAAMLLDHIAWAFLDLHSCWGQLLHFLGRITAPTMCVFLLCRAISTPALYQDILQGWLCSP